MIYKEILIDIDLETISKEVDALINDVGLKQNQLALQYASEESWYAGIGKSDLLSDDEQKYIHFHSNLDNSYIKTFLQSLNFPVSHARIMNLPPKSSYTTHVDYYTRYHIPIFSKPLQSFMIFPDCKDSVVRMYPGKMYWTNTHELHNFVNGTTENRIHIVFNDARESKNLDNKYLYM